MQAVNDHMQAAAFMQPALDAFDGASFAGCIRSLATCMQATGIPSVDTP